MDALIRVVLEMVGADALASLNAGTAALSEGVDNLSESMNDSAEANDKASKSLIDYAVSLIGPKEAAIGAAYAVKQLADSYVTQSIEAQKLATMSGTTVEAFSKIKGAAEDIGVSGETVQTALVMMQRKMQDTGEQGQAFKSALGDMGLSVEEFANSASGTTDLLLAMQERFEQLPDGPQKSALAIQLFSRQGPEMLEFLGQSRSALDDNMKSFDDLAQTITKADVSIAKDIRAVKNDIMDMAESAALAIGRGMAPMFLEAMGAIKAAAENAFHSVVDQFGGVKGATEALTQSLEALRPVVSAIGPVASAAFDAFRGFSFVFTELAALLPLAASGWYELNAAAAWFLGSSDETIEGFKVSAEQAAAMSERVHAAAQAMIGNAEASAVAGAGAQKHAEAISKVSAQVNNATVGLNSYSDATKKAAEENEKAAKAVEDAGTKAALAQVQALEEQQAAHYKARDARYEEIFAAREAEKQTRECTKAIQEQVPWYEEVLGGIKRCTEEFLAQPAVIGDVNTGIIAMAENAATAEAAARAMSESFQAAVAAASSMPSIQDMEGKAMGGSGGGVKIGDTFIPHPQQGLMGVTGMMAAQDFATRVANAQAHEEANKRREELGLPPIGAMPELDEALEEDVESGGATGSSGRTRLPSNRDRTNLPSSRDSTPISRGVGPYISPASAAAQARIDARNAELKKKRDELAAAKGPVTGFDVSSVWLDKEIDAARKAREAEIEARIERSVEFAPSPGFNNKMTPGFRRPPTLNDMAGALKDALKGVSVRGFSGREIARLMLNETRNGRAGLYTPAGGTKAR